jgi:hypothetical protein
MSEVYDILQMMCDDLLRSAMMISQEKYTRPIAMWSSDLCPL